MSHGQFYISHNNPNDVTGGGGCVCSPEKQVDCRGPFVVVPGNDMDGLASPHVVVGAPCAHRMVELLAGEILGAGEPMGLEPTSVSTPVSPERDDSFTI